MTERTLPTALRWAARWRAAARIARRDAARHRGRTALVAALVALPLIAGSAGLVLVRSTEPSDASIVRDTLGPTVQAQVTVECENAPYTPSPDGGGWCAYGDGVPAPLTTDQMDRALSKNLPTGSTAVPLLSDFVDYIDGPRSQVSKSFTELDATDRELWSLSALETGRVPRDASEILVSGHMARSALLEVGDTVGLRPALHGAVPDSPPVTFTVVGTSRVEAGIPVDFIALPGSGLAPFDDEAPPHTWYVLGDTPILTEHAEKLHALGLEVVSRDVIPAHPSRFATSSSVVTITSQIPGNLTNVSSAVAAVAILVILLEAVLLIGPAFVVGARRETRNLALIAATGGEPSDLRRVVLATGLVVGGGAAVVGTSLGTVLGIVLVPALRSQDIYVPDVTLPVAELCAMALGGAVLALAAAWWPARQAARTDVVAALSGRRSVAPGRRRSPLVGLASLALGALAALAGALTGWGALLLVGVLALELGVIGTAGSVVGRLARVAHRTGPALRYALRDADRHRARTAPALAAIIAATAVAATGLTYQTSQDAADQRYATPAAAVGTLVVTVSPTPHGDEPDNTAGTWDEAFTAYRDALAGALDVPLVEVQSATPSPSVQVGSIERLRPPETACTTEEKATDARCGAKPWGYGPFDVGGERPIIVDDGTTVRALGLPDAEGIARSLANGLAVVASSDDLWTDADGSTSAHLAVPGHLEPIVVPAVAHPWGAMSYQLILPPGLVEQIDWTTTPVGIVVRSAETDPQVAIMPNVAEVPGLQAWGQVQTEPGSAPTRPLAAMIAGAALLSVLATWIVIGLAASESRPDLATISAVGAAPRTRRALAGAQAGVLAVVGTALGIVTGILFGGVLVLAERIGAGGMGWTWQLELPWPLLALLVCTAPALAIVGAALATRSRLPVTRRLAS